MKYACSVCGWEYDESIDYQIALGTPWSEVPEDFECPLCSGQGFLRRGVSFLQERQRR